jgi:hypothetical protein
MRRAAQTGRERQRRVYHAPRLYALAVALVLFFLSWATIAARPWTDKANPKQDPRLTALANREKSLRQETAKVNRLVKRRWLQYGRQLRQRQALVVAKRRRYEQQLSAARAAAERIAAQRRAAYAAAYEAALIAAQRRAAYAATRPTPSAVPVRAPVAAPVPRPAQPAPAATAAPPPAAPSPPPPSAPPSPPPPPPAPPPPPVKVVKLPHVHKSKSS